MVSSILEYMFLFFICSCSLYVDVLNMIVLHPRDCECNFVFIMLINLDVPKIGMFFIPLVCLKCCSDTRGCCRMQWGEKKN